MLKNKLIISGVFSLIMSLGYLFPGVVVAATFDQQMKVGEQSLYLNGEGPRKKAFITVYDTALYLTEKGGDGLAIIEADHPMAVSLVVESRFATAERISEAFREGLENAVSGDAAAIEPQIKAFLAVFEQGVVKQDAFDFIYLPGEGVRVNKNDKTMATVAGLAFKKALFAIWLSDNPVSSKLKSQLLGL